MTIGLQEPHSLKRESRVLKLYNRELREFANGISKEGNLLDIGVELGLITKAGAFFSYGDTRLGQGRESAKQYLKENPELAQEIEERIRASARGTHSIVPEEE